jgi:hypothetical protein
LGGILFVVKKLNKENQMMKKLMSAALLVSAGAFAVGCSASASLDPNHDSSSGSYDKQTTTVQHPDGSVDKTVKTESNP